jgi:outer membrane protein assembly factor BamB
MKRLRLLRRFAAASGLCLLAVCPAGAAPVAAAKATPAPVLVFPLSEEFRLGFEGVLAGPPLAFDGDVILSLAAGRVERLSLSGKKTVWRFAAKGGMAFPALALPDGIILGDRSGRLTRLDPDGRTVWEKVVPGTLTAPIRMIGGLVLAVFDGRTLRAFDPGTGSEKWSWSAETDLLSSPRDWKGNAVLVVGKSFIRLSPGGKPASAIPSGEFPTGYLLVEGDALYAGLTNGTLVRWDLTKGKRRWTVKLGASLSADPVGSGPRIFLSTESRSLFALDKKRGDVLWWQSLPGRAVGEPVPAGPRLLAPALGPVLSAFDPLTGKKSETIDLKLDIVGPPLVLGDRAAVAVRDPVTGAGSLIILKGKTEPPPAAPMKKSIPGE